MKDDGWKAGEAEAEQKRREGRKEERLSPLGSWKKEEEQVCTGLASSPVSVLSSAARHGRRDSAVMRSGAAGGANNEEEVRKQRTADRILSALEVSK